MTDIKSVLNELKAVKDNIEKVTKMVGYAQYEELSNVSINLENENDIFYNDELLITIRRLDKIREDIKYLTTPIKCESSLFKNEGGRYETQYGDVYTSGSMIEYRSYDDWCHEHSFWRKSRIEHNGEDYYIVCEPKVPLKDVTDRKSVV